MNRFFAIFGALAAASGALIIVYTYTNAFGQSSHSTLNIAILTPTTHPALEHIEGGFIQKLNTLMDRPVKYHTYNAHANRTLMHAQVADAVASGYDLIFTIGTGTTLMIGQYLKKSGAPTPQVFAAISDPIGSGIKQTEQEITGITDEYDPHMQVDALLKFKPQVKHVALVLDPTQAPQMQFDAHRLEQELTAHGIHVYRIEVFNVAEINKKVHTITPETDVVMVLTDNTVVSGLDALVKFCMQHAITLVASDLDSGVRGAALAVGVIEADYGRKAALLAHAILAKKVLAHTLAYRALDQKYVQINTRTMVSQRLTDQATLQKYPVIFRTGDCVCIRL